jgi:hypothetical protein
MAVSFPRRPVYKTKVILLTVLAATTYGVLHDEITIRVCPEYFTMAHPPFFGTPPLTILALCWGIAATLGIGVILGAVLAIVAEAGGKPPVPLPRLGRALLRLLAAMAASALLAGWIGYVLSRRALVSLPTNFAEVLSAEEQRRFMGVWFAHAASYITGLAGGAALILRIWKERGRPAGLAWLPSNRWAVVRAVLIAALAAVLYWLRFRR